MVTGSVDWTDQTLRQVSPVSRVIVNPSYVPLPEDTFDAALLVLSNPTTAPAIPLATSSDEYFDVGGTGAVIAGWGQTYYGDPFLQTSSSGRRSSSRTPLTAANLTPTSMSRRSFVR